MNHAIFFITMAAVLTISSGGGNGLETTTTDGFSFKYPSSWDLKEKENRFTSVDATLEYDKGGKSATISFEHDPELSENFQTLDTNSLHTLERVLGTMYDGSSIFEKGSDKYFINNQTAHYAIATFSQTNLFGYKNDFVVPAIAIYLGNNDLIIAQYITNQNDFDKLLGDAEQIFQSVKPVGTSATDVL